MIPVYLVLFAVAVGAAAPRVLSRARWVYRSPRLGIAAWYAVMAGVSSAAVTVMVLVVAPWRRDDAPVCVAWRWCAQAVRGEFGIAGRALAVVVLLLGAALAVRLVACGVRLARSASARHREHLQLLALAGRPSTELGVTVVEYPEPAAYMVAGPGRHVVVTTGALDALDDEELAAVLAHERAHAAGRHDLLLGGVAVLQTAFAGVALFTAARAQLGRLVELRADEVAVTDLPRMALARALVAMASRTAMAAAGTSPPAPLVAGAVAATGGDAAERLRRLLVPPATLTGWQRTVAAVGIAGVAFAPAVMLAASLAFPALNMCPPMSS